MIRRGAWDFDERELRFLRKSDLKEEEEQDDDDERREKKEQPLLC